MYILDTAGNEKSFMIYYKYSNRTHFFHHIVWFKTLLFVGVIYYICELP